MVVFSFVCFGGDEMAIAKLKRHKPLDIDQIPTELITAGGRNLCYQIHKLVNSIRNEDEFPAERKESIIVTYP